MDSFLTENGLRDEDCCVEISDYHLKKISNSVCKDWRLMPSYLEMEEIVVSDTELDCKDMGEQVKRHKFLSTWKSQKGSAATYKKLMEALLEMKCKSEAEKVCKIVRQLSNNQEDPINAEDTNTEPNNTTGTPTQAVSEASNADLDPKSPIYKDLKLQLDINLERIHTQYASYVSTIRYCLQKKITCQELRTHLRNMPVFLKNDDDSNKLTLLSCKADKLKEASSIDEIFNILDTECCSFLDFALYESLIKHYNLDEGQEHLKYMEHVTNYLYGHTVTEFMMINPGLLVRSDILDKLSFKFDIEATCKLAKIKELKTAIAKILGLHESGLQLFDISEGCVSVTFLISKPVSQHLFFSSESVLTCTECISKQENLPVLWMKLNENTLFDVTKNCESQESQISSSVEKTRSKSVKERGFRERSYNITGRKTRHSTKERSKNASSTTKDTLEEARKQLEHLSQKGTEATCNQQPLPPDTDTEAETKVPSTQLRVQPAKKPSTLEPDSGTASEIPSTRTSLYPSEEFTTPEPDSGLPSELPSTRSSFNPSKKPSYSTFEPDSGTANEASRKRLSLLKPSKKLSNLTASKSLNYIPSPQKLPLVTASSTWHVVDLPNRSRTALEPNAPSIQPSTTSGSEAVPSQHSTEPDTLDTASH